MFWAWAVWTRWSIGFGPTIRWFMNGLGWVRAESQWLSKFRPQCLIPSSETLPPKTGEAQTFLSYAPPGLTYTRHPPHSQSYLGESFPHPSEPRRRKNTFTLTQFRSLQKLYSSLSLFFCLRMFDPLCLIICSV